jgi:uncharacterized membrane protein YkvA (DUF1232 family)
MHLFLTALLITAAIYFIAVLALLLAGHRAHARELAVLLPNLLRLFKGLIQDSRVPRGSKAWLIFAAAWIASPIDLLPEFLPIVGPLDDAVVAALVLRHLLKTTDQAIIAEHWHGAPATLETILRLFALPATDKRPMS